MRFLAGFFLLAIFGVQAQPAKPPKSVRLYIFDCGVIKGLNPAMFGLQPGEAKASELVVPCYLVVHPKGTLIWDVGVVPDSKLNADGSPVTAGNMTATKTLQSQLAAVGYKPTDITYIAHSHYHSDHTANSNDFAGSTWLVHPAEREAMFSDKPGLMDRSSFSALREAKTKLLGPEDYDVFGDGKVVIKFAPGHTPGHQVLFLNFAKAGPVLVAGDLYHYPEEKTLDRYPTFEFSVEQSRASRAAVEAFLRKTKAQMWIEHDQATYLKLKHAPEFYE
ncbi:MAG: N-acyl homoserine lactonase family protein [Bryobacteraceae bacterium]